MNDFKLELYFQKFKDKPLPTRDEFRCKFKKKYGELENIEQLIMKIEKYQIKKYGQTLYYDYRKERKKRICNQMN